MSAEVPARQTALAELITALQRSGEYNAQDQTPPAGRGFRWKDGQFTGERVNDAHLTNAEKWAARERAVGARRC